MLTYAAPIRLRKACLSATGPVSLRGQQYSVVKNLSAPSPCRPFWAPLVLRAYCESILNCQYQRLGHSVPVAGFNPIRNVGKNALPLGHELQVQAIFFTDDSLEQSVLGWFDATSLFFLIPVGFKCFQHCRTNRCREISLWLFCGLLVSLGHIKINLLESS